MTRVRVAASSEEPYIAHGMKRREILRHLAIGSAALAGALAFLGSLRFSLPSRGKLGEIVRLGRGSDFPPNSQTFLPDVKLYVLRDERGLRAVSAVCTHLGCTVRATEDGFRCPCHGSAYDREGMAVSGPAPAPLRWFKTGLMPDGRLQVDLSQPVSSRHGVLI
jgi:nitrite reductase/ring-hydroxylating ferredoxin subunit